MFSVLILTLNEAHNLPACLASVSDCNDVVVLDSGSTDATAAIARAAGARVAVHPFENFAAQRNHAHTALSWTHDWIFHLDADERFTPELAAECRAWISAHGDRFDGAWVAPKMLWEGRWIPRCTDYPAWQARLAHRHRFRFIEVGHGQREAPGLRLDHLRHSYEHDLSVGGIEAWWAKHRRYAAKEASDHLSPPTGDAARWRHLSTRDALTRRRTLKRLSQDWPARGALRWIYQYLLRGGILEGSAGWTYCRLLARYEREVSRQIKARRKARP